MYIPDEMKVNKFVDVAIPSNKSYFNRLGEVSPDNQRYSGDDVVPEQMSKTEEAEFYNQYAEEEARKLNNK